MIMKTIKYSLLTVVALVCFAATSYAQVAYRYLPYKKTFFNVDWQYNFPLDNGFAEKSSGWGMNFEGGYYLTEHWGVGGFISFHTNNEYVSRETIPLRNGAITTDRQNSLFQLPFGVSGRYRFLSSSILEPYVSAKLGANYSRVTSEFYIYESYERPWGFYVSPEVGMNINFTRRGDIGLHVAAYYSYATNKADVLNYGIDGLSNFGLRIGLKF